MKNEKRAQLEAQHQKKLESLREEVIRLTSLLEQASRSKSKEATFTTQSLQMPTTPFNPQNFGANEVPPESQQTMYF